MHARLNLSFVSSACCLSTRVKSVFRRTYPQFNLRKKKQFAVPMELILKFRVQVFWNPSTFSCRLTC